MKSGKKFNFNINYQVYPFDLMVSIGETVEEIKKKARPKVLESDYAQLDLLNDKRQGEVLMLENTGATIIRLKEYSNTPKWKGVLAHEVSHCVQFLFLRINMPLVAESMEAYSYLQQFITQKIYEKLQGK